MAVNIGLKARLSWVFEVRKSVFLIDFCISGYCKLFKIKPLFFGYTIFTDPNQQN